MVDVIIYSLILALVTQWLLPMILNTKNMDWMLSNRDESVDISVMCSRAKRASVNFQELPRFFGYLNYINGSGSRYCLTRYLLVGIEGTFYGGIHRWNHLSQNFIVDGFTGLSDHDGNGLDVKTPMNVNSNCGHSLWPHLFLAYNID